MSIFVCQFRNYLSVEGEGFLYLMDDKISSILSSDFGNSY